MTDQRIADLRTAAEVPQPDGTVDPGGDRDRQAVKLRTHHRAQLFGPAGRQAAELPLIRHVPHPDRTVMAAGHSYRPAIDARPGYARHAFKVAGQQASHLPTGFEIPKTQPAVPTGDSNGAPVQQCARNA